MTRAGTLLASLVVAFAAGCASYGGYNLKPGVDTEAQVRASMGEPAMRFQQASGGSTWAYPRGPTGYDTFMAHFNGSGTLTGIESVLDPDHFARVARGMSKEEVAHILGPPGREEAFRSRGELVWDYRFMDAWGYPSNFSAIFDRSGRVSNTLTLREQIDDD